MSASTKRVYGPYKGDCDRRILCDCQQDLGCAACKQQHPFPKKTILSCGQGFDAVFINPNDPPITVASVIVDTRDIVKPTVGIQFSSVVQFLATFTSAEGRLIFQLLKACDNGNPLLLNTWVYEFAEVEGNPGDFDALRFSKSFNFNFCEFPACSGCCEYFVRVSIDNISLATIFVNNNQITALAQ